MKVIMVEEIFWNNKDLRSNIHKVEVSVDAGIEEMLNILDLMLYFTYKILCLLSTNLSAQ